MFLIPVLHFIVIIVVVLVVVVAVFEFFFFSLSFSDLLLHHCIPPEERAVEHVCMMRDGPCY